MEIHTSTTKTSNGWHGGVRYDTPNGMTHCLGRHGWPSEQDADQYARDLAKYLEDDDRALVEARQPRAQPRRGSPDNHRRSTQDGVTAHPREKSAVDGHRHHT